MILFTQVGVPMTEFRIDVMIGGTKEENQKVQIGRYGFSDGDVADIVDNECVSLTSGSKGVIKPQKTFLLHLKNKPLDDISVFIHEIWHLMWHISDTIGDFKLTQSTQSWAACMIEQISRDIINAKYEELNLEYGE